MQTYYDPIQPYIMHVSIGFSKAVYQWPLLNKLQADIWQLIRVTKLEKGL